MIFTGSQTSVKWGPVPIQAFRFIRHTIWCFFACKFSSIKNKLDIYVNHYIFFCVFSFFTHSPFLCFRIAGTECHIKTTQTVVGRFTGWSDGLVLSKWVVLGQNKQLSTVKSFRNIKWQTGQLKNYNNLNIDRPGTPINHDKKDHVIVSYEVFAEKCSFIQVP